jgi:hypothetical protein
LLLDRFRGGCHRQLACPSVDYPKAAVAGIEPASGRLTAAYPYQHGSHRKTESAWPDLNRHFLHGEQIGSRYIMGALSDHQIVKDREHRAGVEPTSPSTMLRTVPRVRSLRR